MRSMGRLADLNLKKKSMSWFLLFIFVFQLSIVFGEGSPGEPLVEFYMAGGFAGMQNKLLVYPDGFVRLEHKDGKEQQSFCTYPEQVQIKDLQGMLDAAEFCHLKPEYIPKHHVYDGFVYRVTYKGYTISMYDPIEGTTPESLLSLVNLLKKMVQDVWEQKQNCP